MTETTLAKPTYLFDDPSAVEAFIKKGWLEKVSEGKAAGESWCRYTPKGLEFRDTISRFEAN